MIENHAEILNRCIDEARGKPFVRGKHDCCMWAADVVMALTGTDYAEEFRGRYTTLRGALRILKRRSLADVVDTKFKQTDNPLRGDLVLIPSSITEQPIAGLGICIGVQIAIIGDDGLEFLPLAAAEFAWSVQNG